MQNAYTILIPGYILGGLSTVRKEANVLHHCPIVGYGGVGCDQLTPMEIEQARQAHQYNIIMSSLLFTIMIITYVLKLPLHQPIVQFLISACSFILQLCHVFTAHVD